MKEKKYIIDVDHEKKVISMKFLGNLEEEEVSEFHQHYLETITPIEASEYLLLLNSLMMGLPAPERMHQMQVSFALYRKSGFNEICFIVANHELKLQVQKLVLFSGMSEESSVKFIAEDEVAEVLALHTKKLQL